MRSVKQWWQRSKRLAKHRKLREKEPEWQWLRNRPYQLREHLEPAIETDGHERLMLAWHDHRGQRVSPLYGSDDLARQSFGFFHGEFDPAEIDINDQPA